MKTLQHTVLALAALACGLGQASAQTMGASDYRMHKERIEGDYRLAKDKCDALAGAPKHGCRTQAEGEHDMARAKLDMDLHPSAATRYKASLAVADAAYDNARAACNAKNANAKDVCIKEAKAARVAAKADAKVQRTATNAQSSADAQNKDARAAAADDKSTAAYKVAVEKCDNLSGETKTRCVDQAKATYGK